MPPLAALLNATAELHRHLCPRQVLGVRLGLAAGAALGVPVPQADRRLLAFVETDGCAADGIAVATGCWVGHRTLRVVDYGKVALTLVDTASGRAVRAAPRPGIRSLAVAWAREHAPQARTRWQAMLQAYSALPEAELVCVVPVALNASLEALLSRPGRYTECAVCGEEIINERELRVGGRVLCQACARGAYYRPA